MAARGRKPGTHHGRREVAALNQFEGQFADLASGLNAWLDRGDYEAFIDALTVIEDSQSEPLPPVDPKAPRGERLHLLARRYAAATFANSFMGQLRRAIDDRIEETRAELLATATEPADIPQYWVKLVKAVQAAGIRQEDVHPGSRALAEHIAKAIREFRAAGRSPVDESYSDAPLASWAELPPAFAGFKLVDVSLDDDRFIMPPTVFPLPPSTDIADFTADRVAPPTRSTRQETYRLWMKVIEDWAARKNEKLPPQQAAVWSMLLGYRLREDGSDVTFFNGKVITSPWKRGGVVMIEVWEDDVPDHVS